MKTTKLFSTCFPIAIRSASSQALAITTYSRSRRQPEREAKGALQIGFKVAFGLLIVGVCSLNLVFGKPPRSARNLTTIYALDKRVAETDGIEMKRNLALLLSRPEVQLFLKVIQTAEAGEPNLMVGGCRAKNLKQHPALTLPRKCFFPVKFHGKWMYSTASGNYQITYSNWKVIAHFLGLRNFSVTSQQLAALELIRRGGGAAGAYTPKGQALKARIQKGFTRLVRRDPRSALCLATQDWASSACSTLPGYPKLNYAALADRLLKRKRDPFRRSGGTVTHHASRRRSS